MCVLLLALRDRMKWAVPTELRDGTFEQTGAGLLSHLWLLFIPAGVGVIQRLDVLTGNALPILLAVTASTVLSMAVSAWVFALVARRTS
jgi:holin-like protein